RWDLAGLADARYFVRLRVTDGNGAATTLDSYYSINLYHQAPAPPADMSMAAARWPMARRAIRRPPGGGCCHGRYFFSCSRSSAGRCDARVFARGTPP